MRGHFREVVGKHFRHPKIVDPYAQLMTSSSVLLTAAQHLNHLLPALLTDRRGGVGRDSQAFNTPMSSHELSVPVVIGLSFLSQFNTQSYQPSGLRR